MLDFFAVRLDGLTAEVKLRGNLAGAVCGAQKLKHLHLTIGQAFDADKRIVRFFAQGSLHDRCGDSFAEIQFSGENFAHCSQHLIGSVFLHDITRCAGAKRAFGKDQFVVLRKHEHFQSWVLNA